MGLEEIVNGINKDTQEKIEAMMKDANAKADRIIEEAKREAEVHKKEMDEKAKHDAQMLDARERSRANIESRHIYDNAVNSKMQEILYIIRSYLSEYVKTADYGKLLNKLESDAEAQLGSDCTVFVMKRDMPILKGAKAKIKAIGEKNSMVGGLEAESADGTRSVDYSLEHLFEDLKQELSAEILKIMMG
ncbi:MAG: V-type ATP synthase subunit E [Candidatus Marsarchaeota archaeon]|nr:V-type ATP synthase subunit E [Candidatus Marsarchaeota archaeon]